MENPLGFLMRAAIYAPAGAFVAQIFGVLLPGSYEYWSTSSLDYHVDPDTLLYSWVASMAVGAGIGTYFAYYHAERAV